MVHPDPGKRHVCRHHGGGPASWKPPTSAPTKRRQDIGSTSICLRAESEPYITPSLNFEFHYFFMRKFWFAYLAKALVIFPGGFGTLDEFLKSSLSPRRETRQENCHRHLRQRVLEKDRQLRCMVDAGVISASTSTCSRCPIRRREF